MKKVYRAFKGRQTQRRKAFATSVVILIVGIGLGAYINYTARWFFSYWVGIVLFSFMFGFFYLVSRSWISEYYETAIFVDMYEAFEFLEQCSNEDEESLFSLRKASNKVKDAIKSLNIWGSRIETVKSKLIKTEYAEPLTKLAENLETRILPRIAQHKDIESMRSVVWGLANVFSKVAKSTTLDYIISLNKDLERYKAISDVEAPSRLGIILSREPIKLSVSILVSFSIITIAVFTHSKFYQTNLYDSISDITIFLEILGIGIALVVGIYTVWGPKFSTVLKD